MADTVKTSRELKTEFGFYDNDTRTVTLENPRTDLTAADIKAVATLAANTQPIIGDKGGARVVGINSAKIVEKTVVTLDLNE